MEELTNRPHRNGRGFSIGRLTGESCVARHEHRSAHLVLVYAGSWIDGAQRPTELRGGQILYHPPNTWHESSADADADVIVADLHRELLSAIWPLHGGRSRTLRYDFQAFDELPARLYEEVVRNDASSVVVAEAVLLQIMAAGARLVGAERARPEWLSRVTAYIHMHAHQSLTIATLAAVGAVSPSRLSHGFREHTGKTVTTYIREYRLRVGARALRQTSRPIKDIALNYGFYDHAHFTREFAKLYGVAPIEYRRRTRLAEMQIEKAERADGEVDDLFRETGAAAG